MSAWARDHLRGTDAMMRVIVRAYGGPEQLQVEPMTQPLRPAAGELVVEVEAAGINYLDVYQRKGVHRVTLPLSPGLEGVGRVCDVGAEVDAAGVFGVG